MACTAITDYVVRESGRYLDDQILRRTFGVSPWITLMPRGVFPSGMGETINILTYERAAPSDAEPTWSSMAVSDGAEGGICLPAASTVAVGSTTRNFNLARRVLEGPDFCAEEMRTPFAIMQQLDAIAGILAAYSTIEWEIRDRHEYFRLVKRKVVVNLTLTESNTSATTYPASCPTSILTQGVLDRYKMKLLRDGAAQSALGKVNGNPVLTAIVSAETSDNIIKRNSDARDDLRWGNPSMLLQQIGVEREYRGFFHVIDMYPRRFNCDSGTYTEYAAFADSAATKGTKSDVNSDWEAANIEESFIFDPQVMTQLIPAPVGAITGQFPFNPLNYTGIWRAVNIPDRTCNPDENIVYHRGILAAASMPKHPERGIAFAHLRCDPALDLVTSCT